MGRAIGLVAIALGTFLLVSAIFLRFYVAGQAIKFPLDEYRVTTFVAHDVSYFSTGELREFTGVTMADTSTTEGDVASGTGSVAVWNNFSYVEDLTNGLAYSSSLQRLAFNRRSGELVNCCGSNIGGKKVHVLGLGYEWPLNAQRKTYLVFDTTLLRPHPARYAGTATIGGLATYKYVETIAPTEIATQTMPGSLVGMADQQTVRLGEYYAGTTTEWVDPVTGEPVSVTSARHLYLRNSSGAEVLNLLKADFVTTPASVAAAVQTAKSDDAKISILTVVLPLTIGVAGLIILIMGIVAARAGRTRRHEGDTAAEYGGAVPV